MLSHAAAAPPHALLQAALEIALTGFIFFRPLFDPAEPATITDLAYVHLNPAAQRMLQLPECPAESFLTLYPNTVETGIFAFYRDTFLAGGPGRYDVNYQADGLDNYFQLAAHRAGDLLVVSFSDTADQPRTKVELALRESQAREREARADAESQRQRLYQVLMNLPAQVATFYGPDHRYTLLNQRYQQYFPTRALLGRPVREAVPAGDGQRFFELLDQVYATGEAAYRHEVPVPLDFAGTGQPELLYLNAFYLPLRDAHGQVDGVLDFTFDVTEQVMARQQLQALNQELETRVAQRTREVEAARQRLDQAFRQAPFYLNLYRGPEHVFELVHPLTQALFGERVLLGQPRREALPELGEDSHRLFDLTYTTGQAQHHPELRTTIDREGDGKLREIYFDIVYQPLFDAQGQVEGVLTLSVDATERVLARRQGEALQAEALQMAQHRAQERQALFQVFEQTAAVVALLRSPNHRYEYVNPAYQAFFPGRQLVGLDLAVAAPELVEQGFKALLDRVFQTGETFFGTELAFTSPAALGQPARTSYFNFTYQAYREGSEIAGVSIFAYDVTEQVLARQERAAQQQRLEQLFMQAPAAICILAGPELVYELVNPGYQDLFPDRQLLGRPILDALPEISAHAVYQGFRKVYEQGVTLEAKALLVPLARPDDGILEDRYFNYVQQARRDAAGQPDGVLVFAFEVTEQVQARQQAQDLAAELTTANEQLTRTNVDLDNFIYTASHDLKAPISNIEGLLYLLQEELPTEVAQHAEIGPTLTRMLDAVERFKRTIDHLTDVSKLQKENAPATSLVNLAAVVEDVRQDLLPELQAAGARLFLDVSAQPLVQFSEKNLRSIVYNLLSNAVKYRHPDRTPHVDVRAHVRPGHTVLEVHDNGLGLDPAHLPRLFTMFQRFHDHVEGTGIGLYMVKRMVENAGGRIEVHSQLGAGTTFFVFLPHAASPAAPPFPLFLPA